jgi:hypothetical protein
MDKPQEKKAETLGELLEIHQLTRIADALEDIANTMKLHSIVNFKLAQVQNRRKHPMINGVAPGSTETFEISYVPNSNFIPLNVGPSVSADDPKVSLGPVAVDATSGWPRFDATLAQDATGDSFNVTVAGTNDKGTELSRIFIIPIVGAPPNPTSVTDFSLDQVVQAPGLARPGQLPANPRRQPK